MSSLEEIVPVVDMQDVIIGHKVSDLLDHNDIYRVSSLAIVNTRGDKFLLAQRASWKSSPERWSHSADGTVGKDETYRQNIIKEAYEEIGITVSDDILREVWHRCVDNPGEKNKFRHTLFIIVCEEDIVDTMVLEDAVAAVRWWNINDILETIGQSPLTFTESFAKNFRQITQWLNNHRDIF